MPPRSGCFIIDTCGISAILGGSARLPGLPSRHPTFSAKPSKPEKRKEQLSGKSLGNIEWETIYLAFSGVGGLSVIVVQSALNIA
jgi:hypothetical protein